MTSYNRSRYLAIAIDSIIAQTYLNWNLTIWDDGSIDQSLQIAQSYAKLDDRIKVISSHNIGHTRALKQMLCKGNAKYLAWIDSDDILMPEALALTIDIARANPEVGMIYTEHTIINEDGIEQGLGYRCQIPYHKDRLLVDFICHHFRLIRRDVYELVGGVNIDFTHAEDYDLVLRIAEVTEVYQLKIPLYQYRVHSKSMSNTCRTGQIESAARAVRAALFRRGLDRYYYLDVSPTNGFQIKSTQY